MPLIFKLALIAAALLAVVGTGCGKGKKVPGLENFHAGVIKAHLYVSFVSTTLNWDIGATLPIFGLADSTMSVSPDLQSDGTVFQFSISIGALLNQGKPLPLNGLPDGRGLPDVKDGVLPRWDTELNGLSLNFYLSDESFAFFVPLQFKSKKGLTLPWVVTAWIEDERGNRLGKVYAIPALFKNEISGLFVLVPYLGGVTP